MTAPAGDLVKLDHAVNAALMLAWVAQAYGDRVGLMTFDDRVTNFIKPERGTAQLHVLTEALYAIKASYVEPDFGHAMTHLALRIGRPSMGAILHTLNIRLFPEQLAYVVNHAEDRVVIVDGSIAPLFARIRGECKTVEHVIVLGEGDTKGLEATQIYNNLRRAQGASHA
jgi:fatty-acyl-CoA synthase